MARRSRPLRRGIYLLPTLFTVGNLFCGFWSLVLVSRERIYWAAAMIVFAALLDGLDGRMARMTGTTSEFGVQFDSLADAVSFGVAPALLAYRWGLIPLGRLGWLLAFLFCVCAAMRLARFNIQAGRDRRFFVGLPAPMAALVLASGALVRPELPTGIPATVLLGLTTACLALLMVSRIRYRSFKELDLRRRRSYVWVLPLAALLIAFVLHPLVWMLAAIGGYLISGPAFYLGGLVRRTWTRPRADVPAEVSDEEPALR
ncbi:MAG TPA: CDP-diacylglycerol--serine O-phosphatidyltransferase [Candidatus Polarisedimenticolaceae bacterium]|nr:CDP-diacylglycerol--serine O-phosphatidyltransferase [Candidatus Polarisedimenticolaceae bacterium]